MGKGSGAIVVSGSSGLVGKALCTKLVEEGRTVVPLVRDSRLPGIPFGAGLLSWRVWTGVQSSGWARMRPPPGFDPFDTANSTGGPIASVEACRISGDYGVRGGDLS